MKSSAEKEEVLDKLANMTVEQLDKLRDCVFVEHKNILKKLHLAKDEYVVKRHEKKRRLLSEGNSFSKAEIMLRADDELFELSRVVSELQSLKQQVVLKREIIDNYYWRAKA